MPIPDLPSWMLAVALSIDLVAILRAVTRAHGVQKTLAWLLAIVAFPVVGGILYLTLANPSIRRTTRRRIARRLSMRGAGHHGRTRAEDEPRIAASLESVFALASNVAGLAPTAGSCVDLLVDNSRMFRQMEQALERAQHTIWAEYYIVRNDETGRRFLEILAERARNGVEVRFLYDALGSWRIDPARTRAIRAAGGHVEAFLPLNPLRRRWAVHLRNHRKIVIVDGEVGFTGGMNVGDEYSGRARRRGGVTFRDTALEMHGPAVADLAQIFIEDWAYATGETLDDVVPTHPTPRTCTVAIVPSGPDQDHNASQLVYFAAINAARQRLWLTCPYFIPDEAVMSAMLAASLRGVDVRLLAPARSDVLVAALAGRSYFPPLARAGVRIFEYLPAILHAKTLLVDDELSLVGSANVDTRSFVYNFELSVLIADRTFANTLAKRFEEDQLQSREYVLGSASFPVRLLHNSARLFSPLL